MDSHNYISAKMFSSLFAAMQEGFALHEVVFDEAGAPVDYRYIDVNPAFEKLTGLTREGVVGKRVREVLPEIEELWVETFCRVGVTGRPEEVESYVKGLERYYRARAYSPERNIFVVIFEDITVQRKALLELTRREEQMRVLFETSRAGILLVDPTGAITLANRRMAEMFGYSMEELLQTRYPDHVHADQRIIGDDRMRKLIAGEIDHVSTERHYIRKGGGDFWGYLSGRRHEDADGNFIGLVGQITDITEMIQAQEATRESEERFRTIIDNLQDVYFRSDAEGRLVMVSPSGVQLLGYIDQDEMLGRVIRDTFFFDTAEQDTFIKELKNKKRLYNYEVTLRRKDGSPVLMATSTQLLYHADGTTKGVEGTFRDMTEMKRAENDRLNVEQRLLHAQKLESLGVLAGGIAHDFNNILTSIIGNADLALRRVNKESPVVDNLRRIENAASRAADLARQMLAYSGKGKFVVENIDLNILLEEMLHMLEVSISKKAVLRFNLHKPLPSVEADATQMRQIIMNLAINASEAIGDTSGVIAITTGCMDCDRSYLKNVWLNENLSDGLYVYLEIADSGCGMDKDTLERMFDPFFTTKFTGRGLGMAAVLGIVRSHKGAIKVYSELNKGTSFKVLLPASGKPAELFNEVSQRSDWKVTGTVLLVDDEETIRGIGSEMLKELGFSVVTACDGREAVDIFRSRNDIVLAILDLTMPHMDGEQCFRELRQSDPAVKVIMSSGYNENEVMQKFVGKGLAGFIQKPYRLSALNNEILKALLPGEREQ